jgi:phosphoesterase RecJ-like protein
MNFKESKEILNLIKRSNNILINLHRGPDPDSFSSAFSLYVFVQSLNKDASVLLVKTSELSDYLLQQKYSDLIKFVDYKSFDFNKYDLFISPDSASWQQIANDNEVKIPDLPIVVIDHHSTNERFGKINIIDPSASSCSEMVYKLLVDWKFDIDVELANILLSGIIADTGGFVFSDNPETFILVSQLMGLGANKTEIMSKMFRTRKFETVKYWGICFEKLEFDKEHKFVWVATSYEIENKFKINDSNFATLFSNIIDGTNFGVVMSEDEPKSLKVSFRGRGNFDVSVIAKEFGGGGHKLAAGAKVDGLSFGEAVEKVLAVCRKYAK